GGPSPQGGSPASKPTFGVAVAGGGLVSTLDGSKVQLRGVNISGLEYVAIGAQGWANGNPWGGQTGDPTPNWQAIRAWKANAVRLPLNEASWLGYKCVDRHGNRINPDPWGNYQSTVKKAVADAVASGLYVIIDLHWTAPHDLCPVSQDQLPDADHSVDFWRSVADTFKDNPAVIFDLFNEPYAPGAGGWQVLRDGATQSTFSADSGKYVQSLTWQSVGMQTLINTVRATGATNIVMVGGLRGASDLSGWLAYRPSDPLKQLAASWHAYEGTASQSSAAAAVLAAGVPVIIGETGDQSANGTASAPIITSVTNWADEHGVGVLAWTWDLWKESDGTPSKENLLIKDAAGTPTDGEGVAFKEWLGRH
ncbi:MAG: glycoside hydrolase family 5 protein, partial [Isosphaeraceae bacterium]